MTKAKVSKTPRSCGWCDIDISEMRGAARYCCVQHRKNAASARHRERNPNYYRDLYQTPDRRQYMRDRYETNKDKILEYNKQYMKEHAEYYRAMSREWFKANPEKHRTYQANRRARKAGNPGSLRIDPAETLRLLRKGRCFYCLDFFKELQLDHVVPLTREGRHAPGNLVPSCAPCNSTKRANLIIELKRKGVTFPWSTPIRREACHQL